MTNHDKAKQRFEAHTGLQKGNRARQRGLFVITALLVGGLFFVGCTSDKMGTKEKVTVGIARSLLSTAVYIAQKQGFFSDEGLDVTVKEYGSGKKATQALFAGEIDISTVSDMPVVLNSFKRQDFCIFATFAYSYPFVKVIARRDKGIRTGADLKGKKVGANWGTSSHFFLGVFLIHNRLSISDVEMINIKTIDLPAALKNNEVDAISVWQLYTQEAMQLLGDNAIELPSAEIYRTTFSFAVMKRFGKEHPKILQKILRAIDKACAFIRKDREKAQEIITAIFSIDKNTVSPLLDGMEFDISLDQSLLVGWDEIARWAIANKLVDHEMFPDYLNYICPNALEAVKPESITIIGWRKIG